MAAATALRLALAALTLSSGPCSAKEEAPRKFSFLLYLPMSSPSHANVFRPLARGLADRGHHVTVVSPFAEEFPPTAAGYTEVVVDAGRDFADRFARQAVDRGAGPWDKFTSMLSTVQEFSLASQRAALRHPALRDLLARGGGERKVDVVIVSSFLNDVGYFIADRLNASLILLNPSASSSFLTIPMGYFDNPSFVTSSSYERPQTDTPCLLERAALLLVHLLYRPLRRAAATAAMEDLIREEGLMEDGEPLDLLELEGGASFGLYFNHWLFDAVRPTLPSTADVGAIQCKEAGPLGGRLRGWFGRDGRRVVLVSFGSWLSTEHLSPGAQSALLGAARAAAADFKFLVKGGRGWAEGRDLPENVLVEEWVPQQDILGHPLTAAFVTQAGMMSVQESLWHGVPILAVPIAFDQAANARRAERRGYGRTISLEDLTAENLAVSLRELGGDPSYRLAAAAEGRLLRDPGPDGGPARRAVFWSEFVASHGRGGAAVAGLASPAKGLGLVRFFHLDVLLVLTGLLFSALWLAMRVSVFLFRRLWWVSLYFAYFGRESAATGERRTAGTKAVGRTENSPSPERTERRRR